MCSYPLLSILSVGKYHTLHATVAVTHAFKALVTPIQYVVWMFKTFKQLQWIKVNQYSSILFRMCAFLVCFILYSNVRCPVFDWLISNDVP